MPDASRVPVKIPEFNKYIITTNKQLHDTNPDTGNPYWKDYGLSNQNQSDWQAKQQLWKDKLYPQYSNPETSTSIAKKNVREFMKKFREFASPLLDKIASSGVAGNAEETIFNFKIRRSGYSRHTKQITDNCMAAIAGITRGRASFSCRTSQDSNRASIPAGADSVVYSYATIEDARENIIDPEDSRMSKGFSTRASFHVDLGSENQGKWLIIYFRWNLLRYPHFTGPWSAMHKTVIG